LKLIVPRTGLVGRSIVEDLFGPFSPKIILPGLAFGLDGFIRVKGLGLKLVSTRALPPSGPIEIILTGDLEIELETEDLNPPPGEAIRVATVPIEDVTALTDVGIFLFLPTS
jgi:hypothetical protein